MKCKENRGLMRILSLAILLVLHLVSASPAEEGHEEEETLIEDYFVCRTCGNDVSVANLLFDKYSPLALSATNHTLTEGRSVLIQEVQNSRGFRYTIFLVKQASCQKITAQRWIAKSSWFPGYAWKFCMCPKCRMVVGFMFEPIETATIERNFPSDAGFYALIHNSIITEGYVNSLLMKEKVLREN
ncbi:uncharacterized protein LOC118461360 [Anopheles albimanus]|uniref:CULT domain-containing protein n=1 Tax=Anopheles albimanus TaxID=7167 RepID=A0A182FNH7_ANOAL|nr:uncharacterized protein LOC118461360 [Anopheles albimanus]